MHQGVVPERCLTDQPRVAREGARAGPGDRRADSSMVEHDDGCRGGRCGGGRCGHGAAPRVGAANGPPAPPRAMPAADVTLRNVSGSYDNSSAARPRRVGAQFLAGRAFGDTAWPAAVGRVKARRVGDDVVDPTWCSPRGWSTWSSRLNRGSPTTRGGEPPGGDVGTTGPGCPDQSSPHRESTGRCGVRRSRLQGSRSPGRRSRRRGLRAPGVVPG